MRITRAITERKLLLHLFTEQVDVLFHYSGSYWCAGWFSVVQGRKRKIVLVFIFFSNWMNFSLFLFMALKLYWNIRRRNVAYNKM